jgi:hypothetical protein
MQPLEQLGVDLTGAEAAMLTKLTKDNKGLASFFKRSIAASGAQAVAGAAQRYLVPESPGVVYEEPAEYDGEHHLARTQMFPRAARKRHLGWSHMSANDVAHQRVYLAPYAKDINIAMLQFMGSRHNPESHVLDIGSFVYSHLQVLYPSKFPPEEDYELDFREVFQKAVRCV